MIVLAALSMDNMFSCSSLLPCFPVFVQAYYAALDSLQPGVSEIQGLGDIDFNSISRAYISLKLWLLLAQKSSPIDGIEDSPNGPNAHALIRGCRMVWNELWPPFEGVVISLLQTNSAANSLVSSDAY
jgi:hypothetical protein